MKYVIHNICVVLRLVGVISLLALPKVIVYLEAKTYNTKSLLSEALHF